MKSLALDRECQAIWVPLHAILLVLFKLRHNYVVRHKRCSAVSSSEGEMSFDVDMQWFITVIIRTSTEPSKNGYYHASSARRWRHISEAHKQAIF